MCAFEIEGRIETDRLVLKPPRLDDAYRIADLVNDYDIARMTSRIPHPYGLADAQAFLARSVAAEGPPEPGFAIQHREFGLIGFLGFSRRDEPFLELGYWLGRTFWGRGFATEAAVSSLAWLREACGRRAVLAGHFADNPASGRVLEKSGFLYTGEVRPRHSLARGEIAPTRMLAWLA